MMVQNFQFWPSMDDKDTQYRGRLCIFLRSAVVWSALMVVGVPSHVLAGESASKRGFTVRDSVEMAYFGTVANYRPDDLDDDGIVSPDGRYAVKLTHRGMLPQGNIEGTIWLFDAPALRRSIMDSRISVPSPVPLIRMSATVNGTININILDGSNTISQPKWAPDSGSVLFRGRNGQANWQIFRIDMGTREVKALTPKNQDVIDYARSGDVIVYLAAPDAHPERDWWSVDPGIPDITIGTGQAFWHLLYPNVNDDIYLLPIETEVWRVQDDVAAPVIDAVTHAPLKVVTKYATETLGLSPDATHLATIAYAKAPVGEVRRGDLPELDQSLQYRVIDLVHGTFELSLDAPIVSFRDGQTGRYRAAWSLSGREIALSETDISEREMVRPSGPSKACTVAILQVAKREVQCLVVPDEEKRGFLYSLEWMPSGQQLRARYKTYNGYEYSDMVIQRNGSSWAASKAPSPSVDLPLELTVREGLNDPPVLVAIDPVSNKRRLVFDPNPQLAEINFGTVIPYEWNDAHGHPVKGGLLKPPNYIPGKRYPLVIQTHGFQRNRFYTYGYSETSNAGRPLASRDVMVLQVSEPHPPSEDDFRKGIGLGTEVYLAAIDQLSNQGLVDRAKVGITGYSFSGFLVSKAITKAPDRFAAAAVANTDPGTMGTYFYYLDYATPDYIKFVGNLVGGSRPYGEQGLEQWIENAPGFATDKIEAPVLVLPSTPQDLISLWPLYASLRDQGKAVDLVYTRSGKHNLRKPLEILAHQEMLVDWFDFWLNGHEDPDPSKAEQYSRWRKLRDARDRPHNGAASVR
jgi:prolyl oligopeptidase family protein